MAAGSVDDVAPPALSTAVAVDILVHGRQSRASLARRMGISAATVTRLVRPLLAADVLVEFEPIRTPGRGRSALALDVVADRYRFIGINLTADTVHAVVTDLRARVLDSEVVPLRSLDVPDVVDTVAATVGSLRSRTDAPVDGIGVTVGGEVAGGQILDPSFLHWHDVPFESLLREGLGSPVHLDNDVVGLTKVQHWFGHGRGCSSLALLTVGAGIGYGLVVNNAMVPTLVNPMSHFPVDSSGPLCPAGHRGCMTAFLASDSIATAASEGRDRAVSFDEALELAEAGDPVAAGVVRRAARALGRAAAGISSTTGVERIILSGEGVHLVDIARESVDEGYTEYDTRLRTHSELVIRPMDFSDWARGAAAVAIQAEFPGRRRNGANP